MTLDLDAPERKHERVRGMGVDWCREDEQDWPCQTMRLVAEIRHLRHSTEPLTALGGDPR